MLWGKFQGIFSARGHEFKLVDIWELRDGNFVTITNRLADLPYGFDLHPLEVSGPLTGWMMRRLDEGYKPEAPMEGPNLWRMLAGDRLVWVGPPRGGVVCENGILGLVTFGENALVYGEPFDFSGDFPWFGGFERDQIPPDAAALCRRGWDAAVELGLPREASADGKWSIG